VPESRPKPLHEDLLKIFGSVERVRIVTTNFDPHFETVSTAPFGRAPELYRAPALPRGSDFSGIVHVHGALSHPADLVLTDTDFGRAYLTEGWARRFLVEVFGRYTVLFVGYSHDDVVMNYVARALPTDSVVDRFALAEKEDNWKALGITPILFERAEDGNKYKKLEDGVHKLAELASRGVLDWQQRLTTCLRARVRFSLWRAKRRARREARGRPIQGPNDRMKESGPRRQFEGVRRPPPKDRFRRLYRHRTLGA
jgi:hypothetical protein